MSLISSLSSLPTCASIQLVASRLLACLPISLQFAKAGIPSFVAALPPQARSLYYRDAIGNISSSGAGLCVSLPFERYKPFEGAVRAHAMGRISSSGALAGLCI